MVYAVGVDLLNYLQKNEKDSIAFPIKKEVTTRLAARQEEWIFFYDIRSELENSLQDAFASYLEELEEEMQMVVDRKGELPFAVRLDWYCSRIGPLAELPTLHDLHKLLRKLETVKVYDERWPVRDTFRPSAKERFNMTILKKWWHPLDGGYLEKEGTIMLQKDTQCTCLTETEYENLRPKSYDIIEFRNIEPSKWKRLINDIHGIVSASYYETFEKKFMISGLDELNNMKRTERGLQQTIWIQKVKKVLEKTQFLLQDLSTNVYGGTSHVYSTMDQIAVGKTVNVPKGVAVMIDMPGIGDAVRLVHLFPEIKERFKGEKLTAIVSSKCCKIYELCQDIDDIFICSLRPDLPKFPYIVPYLLTEYFMTHPFKHVISLAWDTSAYLNNIKQNFFRVYADLAEVQGKKKASFKFDRFAEESIRNVFQRAGITGDKPIIAVQFTASMPSKSWSNYIIAQCVTRLKEKLPDVDLVNIDFHDISSEGIYNVGKYFDIVQLVSILKFCDYFIGVDSSGGHIAAMVDTPAITVYGKEKPRIGNDHRPLSNRNISIIPAENCECPEYDIECIKGHKCIDTVSPETVLYALSKGISLGYSENRKKINLHLNVHSIWKADDRNNRFHMTSEMLLNAAADKQGIVFDLNGFANDIELGELMLNEIPDAGILGVDLWIEENAFKWSSFAIFQLEVYLNKGEKITLSHRLLEGWNLMQYKSRGVDFSKAKLKFKIMVNKRLNGKVCMNHVYYL